MIKRGYTFTHKSKLDPDWEPNYAKCETYAKDAPKAEMRVTHLTSTTVYYGYASGGKSIGYMDRGLFEREYGPEGEANQLRQDLAKHGINLPDWRPME